MKATAKANVAWIKCPPGHGAIDGICKACLEKAITDAVAEKEKEIYNLHSVTLKTMDFRVSAAVTKETEGCAKVVETFFDHKGINDVGLMYAIRNIVAAIRERVKP